ncbi:hypothetical protein [Microbacterium sulfonylureivorans]|uniref:hypothetical protein n=1 Tax=Microbacterium sulfonylureivorans TaxID=2486854 RepID=UPI000FDC4683|nr:hypothetical protein [Microbacterium sulfonylureivorans]
MPTAPARRVLPGVTRRSLGRELLAGVTLIAIAVAAPPDAAAAALDASSMFSRVRGPVDERLRHLGTLDDQPVFETNRAALAALAPTAQNEAST